MRTWLYRSSIRLLTCPAIAMMVESDVPSSASWVIAQCRRSWNRNPGSPAFSTLNLVIPTEGFSPSGGICCSFAFTSDNDVPPPLLPYPRINNLDKISSQILDSKWYTYIAQLQGLRSARDSHVGDGAHDLIAQKVNPDH